LQITLAIILNDATILKVQLTELSFVLCKYFAIKLKGRAQCFSMQVVMNKCFLNLEKSLAQIRLSLSRRTQKPHTLIPKNNVTEPKARLL